MQARTLTLWGGLLLLISGLTLAAVRIVLLERDELEHASPWSSLAQLASQPNGTSISARLTEVELRAGEQALFELCAKDALKPERWLNAFDVVVWDPVAKKVELRVALDQAHLALTKRRADQACLTLGGGRVERSAKYAVDAVWAGKPALASDLRTVPLRARVLAKRPLGTKEGLLIVGAALGALLTIFAAFSPQAAEARAHPSRSPAVWALIGTALALGLAALVLRLPIPGSIGGFARGLGLAAIELGVALACAAYLYAPPRSGLGLHAPTRRAGAWLLAAAAAALVLPMLARWAMRVIPETSEAPIEAFISWPSGALAFAALGMALPLAEELFFRGFVFGALRPLGVGVACLGTIGLFALAHAQQAWGNWGALLSVTLTGAVLTLLRALSGSTLVSAVTHVLYNLSLWTDSFRG